MIASQSVEALKVFEEAVLPRVHKTVRDTIAHLPKLSSGEGDPTDSLHWARSHRPIALARLAAIPMDGGSRFQLPEHLVLPCHRGQKGFPDVYGRMRWDDVAPTLTTGCDDVTKGRFAHPEQNRAITLREAALLQTFPDDYVFSGNRRQIARQIGNAVPVAMIERLAPVLRSALRVTSARQETSPVR
jgi:DNA (cytosine-5)-methyltransferase 1